MTVHIRRRKHLPEVDVRTLRRKAGRLLRLLEAEQKELSILLTDDQEMTELNRFYRNRNRTTDVLAFSQLEGIGKALHPKILGDVVISVPTARRQAKLQNTPIMKELVVLLVHGVLHLLGYEHEKAGRQRAAAMRREQHRLVTLLDGPRHTIR